MFVYQFCMAVVDATWSALASLLTGVLFFYLYVAIETKYIVPRFSSDMNKYRQYQTILAWNRLLFFLYICFSTSNIFSQLGSI